MGKKPLSKPERPRTARLKYKKKGAEDKMECLCLECGVSNYLKLEGQPLDAPAPEEKILANIFCAECGGPLLVRGRAGSEPFYPTR